MKGNTFVGGYVYEIFIYLYVYVVCLFVRGALRKVGSNLKGNRHEGLPCVDMHISVCNVHPPSTPHFRRMFPEVGSFHNVGRLAQMVRYDFATYINSSCFYCLQELLVAFLISIRFLLLPDVFLSHNKSMATQVKLNLEGR